MEYDPDGFLYPKINFSQCDLYKKGKCGICEKKCPVLNQQVSDNFSDPECYCVKANDEIRKKSSSGGFVPVLEEFLAKQNSV
ncbi:MAG TPA: (4Fe-4S)-binding protein, partial [Succinivibrionaceae bacterium]|nr:(4Fe-4S)-binding protein [Succinivibrionaceae bacterium]